VRRNIGCRAASGRASPRDDKSPARTQLSPCALVGFYPIGNTNNHSSAKRAVGSTDSPVVALKGRDTMKNVKIERDGGDLFLWFDGRRIAKRGHPGTPEAGTWIPLAPGYVVTSNNDHSEITIKHDGRQVH
jgi:hypothetical protein